MNALWREVTAHAVEHPPSDSDMKVTFYFGQMITPADEEAPTSPATAGAF